MASLTDYEKGLTDHERGLINRGFQKLSPIEPLPTSIKQQMQAPAKLGLTLMPDGSGYVAPAWVAEVEKHEIGQRMAWDRELKTGQNVSGLVGGLTYSAAKAWGGDPHAASDVGALVDTALLGVYSEHPLNTQTVVNAPRNIVHGAPTYQRPLSPKKRGGPDI